MNTYVLTSRAKFRHVAEVEDGQVSTRTRCGKAVTVALDGRARFAHLPMCWGCRDDA